MKTTKQKFGAMVLSFALLILPTVVYGAGLVPCGDAPPGVDIVVRGINVNTGHQCAFNDIIILANNIIHFLMYSVAVPLAALGFMYAGARLVLFQNKEGEWTEAKGRFGDIALGFGIILGAYVLIKLVLAAFLTCSQINFMRFILDVGGSCTP